MYLVDQKIYRFLVSLLLSKTFFLFTIHKEKLFLSNRNHSRTPWPFKTNHSLSSPFDQNLNVVQQSHRWCILMKIQYSPSKSTVRLVKPRYKTQDLRKTGPESWTKDDSYCPYWVKYTVWKRFEIVLGNSSHPELNKLQKMSSRLRPSLFFIPSSWYEK